VASYAVCFSFVSMALTDVNFRIPSRFVHQQRRKNLKSRGKMTMVVMRRSCSHAHTQAVDIDLDTRKAQCFISVQNMAESMVEISLWHSSVALRTVDAPFILGLLWPSIRNTRTDLFLSPTKILHHYVDASRVSLFAVFECWLVVRIGVDILTEFLCFLWMCLFFCLFVNKITSKQLNIGWNSVGRCIVQKSRQSSFSGSSASYSGVFTCKMWQMDHCQNINKITAVLHRLPLNR